LARNTHEQETIHEKKPDTRFCGNVRGEQSYLGAEVTHGAGHMAF
jgi:hypothetical protein